MAGRNNPRTSGTKRTGGDTAGSIIGNLLLFAVPGVGLIRVAMTAKRVIQAIRAMKGAKKIANPTAAQIKNAKPPSALPKPKSGNITPLTSKPKGDVISGTAREVTPGTSVVPSGGRAVKGPGTKVQRIISVKDKKSNNDMKYATRNDKKLTGSAAKAKKSTAVRNTIIAGTALGAGYLATRDGDKSSSAGTGYSGPLPKSKPSKPAKSVDLGTVKARTVTPQKDAPVKKKPETKKAEPSKVISAGPNTGFGPKGNIFPGSAAERAGYMKMYGGTGSAAARAAAAGKQGDMKAGRAVVDAAKKKRLSKKKD